MPTPEIAPRPTLERIAHPGLAPDAPHSLAPTLPGAQASDDVEYEIPVEGEELGQLGPYVVRGWLGAGAMADVYQAEHRVLGHKVAMKVLRKELTQQDAFLRRFITEGKALTRVQHPNVVRVIDIGRRDDGLTWLAMEFLEGSDLEEVCGQRRPNVQQSIRLMHQLTKAVAAVHEAGVIHRDIKPSNVFLARRRGKRVVKLVDFGIAKLADDDVLKEHDLRGSVIGSPPYLSPEQAQGADTDHRCDIYALGALLFELLSGRTPFGGGTVEEMLAAAIAAPPPAPSQHVDLPVSVRHALDELVVCCLAKDPAHRPSSAIEVERHLTWIAHRLEEEPAAAGTLARPGDTTRQRAAGDSPTIWADLNPADDECA